MPIPVENGVDWTDAIARIEKLPRGEARRIFFDSGKTFTIEHHRDGAVCCQITDGDKVDWIHPPNLEVLVSLLRIGIEQRTQS